MEEVSMNEDTIIELRTKLERALDDLEWIASGPLVEEMEPGQLRTISLEDRHDMMVYRARRSIEIASPS